MVAAISPHWWSLRLRVWANEEHDPSAAPPPARRTPSQRLVTSLASRPVLADALLALLVAAISLPQLVTHRNLYGNPAFCLGEAAIVVPLIWRQHRPTIVFGLVWAVALVLLLLGRVAVVDLSVLIALYTVASRSPRRIGMAALVLALSGVIVGSALHDTGHPWVLQLAYLAAMAGAAYLLGVNVRVRRAYLAAMVERAETLERQRDQQNRIAVAAERAAIAREMHDIVAHSLAVMITMADAAARKGRSDPDRAGAAMMQVSRTGRQTLDETRRLLGVLRAEGSRTEGFLPPPGLAQIDGLVGQVRATGLEAELEVSGEPFSVPEGAQLAAYRIVQEALTNTLKHAVGARRVKVCLRYACPVIEIDVSDDGSPQPEDRRGSGHGLVGMRERAGLYRGNVVAGPGSDGGWSVAVRLDLAATS